ncbi:MAG TPA: hypothetical protein DGG95_02435, partial [Cytophagales bacterium]|nr:hypothetical protein [Cytophagales bacterium]
AAPCLDRWSAGDATRTVSNLAAGIYSVTVTDAEGCSAASSYGLRENNTLRITYAVTPTSCLDNASGAINLTVTGGTMPYTFLTSNGATTEDLQNLTAGSYFVTVTDSSGCQMSASVYVYKKTFQVNAHITQPKCYGDSTGSIILSPTGGTAHYQYTWSTGATTDSLTNLTGGTYTVTVTDSTGCSSLFVYTLTTPKQIQATPAIVTTACNTFSVNLSVTGGTQPFQYQWSTGAQTQDLTGVSPGTYSVVIIDANSCTITQQVAIDSTATVSCAISPLSQPPVCLSSGNMIFSSVVGVQYQWQLTSTDNSWVIQSGATSDTLRYLAGNPNTTATFTLTVNKNGCSQSCTYVVSACSSTGSTGGTNNENCKDAFSSTISKTSDNGTCATYTWTVSTDGNSRYGLSHTVISIPCGQLSGYSDSGNYPLVVGTDPTTGVTGLKVDNVNNFGDQPASITVEFTLCYSTDCATVLQNWNPVVSYKAGLCIAYDTISVQSGGSVTTAYPNPFQSTFQIDVTATTNDVVSVDVCNQYDQKILSSISVPVTGNVKNQIKIDASALQPGIYIYKMRTSTSVYYGRVLKLN